MFVFDARASVLLAANDAARDRYGLGNNGVSALNPADLVADEHANPFRAWLRKADGAPTEEFEQWTSDGLPFAAELRVTTVAWDGRDARLLIVRDIGPRQRIEEHVRQAQKMEAVGRLAGSIAHDFNNLLTAIGGFAELLELAFDAEDPAAEDAREIRRAVDRGAALTRQLLAFSRRQPVDAQVVDLNASVLGMRPLLERLMGEHVLLTLGLDPASGAVRIDPGQLEQVLLNLAINGRDAMPSGGRLLVETAHVELDERYASVRREVTPGRYAVLAVSDEGVGLTEDARAHLFEPFFTTKLPGQGTGLGLATVWGIVRQAGGTVDVFSEPDFGTTFRVYLPWIDLAPGEVALTSATRTALPTAGRNRQLSGLVLVAEDDASVRRVIVQTLTRAGLRVRAAANGAEAMELLDEGLAPDLLVTDVRMPLVSGPELAGLAHERLPHLPILFVSGHTGSDTPEGVRAAGGRLIGKPFTREALLAAVEATLAPAAPLETGDRAAAG